MAAARKKYFPSAKFYFINVKIQKAKKTRAKDGNAKREYNFGYD